MKTSFKMIVAAALFAAPGLAFAQTDSHHPAETAQPQPMSAEMMMSMMQMMQDHMGMMMRMMQGVRGSMSGMGMPGSTMPGGGNMPMQGGGNMPMQGGMGANMPTQGGMSESMAAFMAAMSKMDAPMMQGVQASDPDVAFVKGMIPHHQGAIDMAKVELQYGDDEQVKAWANQIIAAQEKEIAEMQGWLKEHGE